MSGHIELEGTIVDSANGVFRVELDQTDPDGNRSTILCSIAGKLRKNKINLLMGDSVMVKISPYDLSRGIIFFRNKKNKKTR